MYTRFRRRRPRWLKLLGINRDDITKWRPIGLSSIALVCVAIALVNQSYKSNSQISETHKYSTDQSYSMRKLLSGSSSSNSTGPAWESCDYENSTIPALWAVFHTFLIFILFIALAVICDDFFVPSLEAISEKLHLSEDVAGATFMAAGSSAPELFTSIVGVAVETDVGVGTIVGSAIFNLLIIIAMTAALAGQVLELDWRPLMRDSLCYAASVACFIGFTWDGWLVHYEAALFILLYVFYILLMYFNPQVMALMGKWKCCCKSASVVKPMDEPKAVENGDANQNEKTEPEANTDTEANKEDESEEDGMQICPCLPCCPRVKANPPSNEKAKTKGGCWTRFKLVLSWMFFILAFPFVCLFSWTIPDCSKPKLRKWFMVSFLMCVLWLAILTFTMVTLVSRTGCIIGIDNYVMGLVVIAIGTSVPDCLSSVLVAREGYGDMAVSNAIGSNVFDIDLGLGLPFILRIAVDGGKPMNLLSDREWSDYYGGNLPILTHTKFGLILLLILVICLLVFFVVRFRLNVIISVSFVIMYILFLTYAFLQELYCVQKLGIYC